MRCPKCKEDTKEMEQRITNNGKKGKEYKKYERVLYLCKKDDIWISVETPITV